MNLLARRCASAGRIETCGAESAKVAAAECRVGNQVARAGEAAVGTDALVVGEEE